MWHLAISCNSEAYCIHTMAILMAQYTPREGKSEGIQNLKMDVQISYFYIPGYYCTLVVIARVVAQQVKY